MNLVLIIDNNVNNYNLYLTNTLKRFICYKTIHCFKNNYTKVIIVKINNKIYVTEYELHYNNLENIIMSINNILFKKYYDENENYDENDLTINENNIKQIVNQVLNYYKHNNILNDNSNNEIVFINSFTDYSIVNKIHNEIHNKIHNEIHNEIHDINKSNHNSKIVILNISKLINNNTYNHVLFIEFYIDERSVIINDIINKELQEFLCPSDDNIKLINDDNKLIYYMNLFEEYEINCINKNNCDLDKLKDIDILCINQSFKNHINFFVNNIIKNIKNYQELNVIIPNSHIEKELYDTNVKYILDFYSIVYPKLLNSYYYNNSKINANKLNINKINISKIDIKKNIEYEYIEDDSLNYTTSNISMTNWIDEYNEYNPYGILIKYNVSRFGYKGLIDENSTIIYTFPNMIINSISNNWISMNDYYQLILSYKNDNEIEYEIQNSNILNLNNIDIKDALHGDVNIMIPIYINKNHWKLVKSFWKFHISFIHNSLENEYNKKMDNIYYLVLLKIFNNLINDIKNNNIILFTYILRTSIQVTIDNKYINSIEYEYKKIYDQIIQLDNKMETHLINYIIRYIQYCISNCNTSNIEEHLKIIREKLIKNFIKSELENNIMLKEFLLEIDENQRKVEIDNLNKKFIECNNSWIILESTLIMLSKILKDIYKIYGFNQYLRNIDKNNGYLNSNSDLNKKIIDIIINNNNINYAQNIQLQISNYKLDILSNY